MPIDDHSSDQDPSPGAPINVWRDTEGLRMALEEIFETDFVRSRIHREAAGASPETRARMERQIPPRTLAWGYYRCAEYLLHLDALLHAGVPIAAGSLASMDAEGLLAVRRARTAFECRHPACNACGLRQQNRYSRECPGCGAKFRLAKG